MDNHEGILDSNGFHGIFSGLRDLDLIDSVTDNIYSGDFAKFWPRYAGAEINDIPVYSRFLLTRQEHILDLACGDGRIGLALAIEGFRVDGLELSADMLDQCDARLVHESDEVRERLRFFEGDMCNFSLPYRYELIILGATSISLLLRHEERVCLFNSVRRHMKSNGKFIFDIIDFSGDLWKKHDHYLKVLSHENDEGQEFAIVGQRLNPKQKKFTLNVYREKVSWSGETTRALGTSTKAWLEEADVRNAAQEACLTIVDDFHIGNHHYFVAAEI